MSDRKKRLRRIAVLPVLMTLLNGVCGFTAINFAARGMDDPHRLLIVKPELTFFAAAAMMIFLGMVADALDGRLARMARSTSSFGGHLDSMSDMLTFGAAPALLMLWVVEASLTEIRPASPIFGTLPGKLLWLTAAMYVCCAALRLAKFNMENSPEESSHMEFEGLPSPAAAGVIASLVLLYSDICRELKNGIAPQFAAIFSQIIVYALPILTVAVALLMVSQISYHHVVNRLIRGRKPFGDVVRLVLVVLLLFWQLQLTLAIVFLTFSASGAVRWVWHRYGKKRPLPQNPPESHPEKQ